MGPDTTAINRGLKGGPSHVWGMIGIILLGWLAYANSFTGPFVFDDRPAVQDNLTIRHLWPPGSVLHPPGDGSPVTGRPAVNLSLAFNYALGGLGVSGYHALNLILHLMAAGTLYGIVWRTLASAPRRNLPWATDLTGLPPMPIAFTVAALWVIHPLQTESVTYISGRTESLAGLLYLLTLYCFVRAADLQDGGTGSRAGPLWLSLSVAAALAGMASKEVMVTVPVLVFLYDRTFVSGSFRAAWKGHGLYFQALGATWLLLVGLVASAGGRGGTAGFNSGVPWWRYCEIQGAAITHYLRLAVWPRPLSIGYGTAFGGSQAQLWADGALVLALVAMTLVALRRRPMLGFLGCWFFLILAPSSSVIPVATELVAEHRMYLPLIGLCVIAAGGLFRILGRWSYAFWVGMAFLFVALTRARNADYGSAEALWRSASDANPDDAGAHNNLGAALLASGNTPAAEAEFTEALGLDPGLPGAHNNLGLALGREDRWLEAASQFEEAVRLAPRYPDAHKNLADALLRLGRPSEAVAQYEELIRLGAGGARGHSGLALALVRAGRLQDAVVEYRRALEIDPGDADVHFGLGIALVQSRSLPEAVEQFAEASRLRPGDALFMANLGGALVDLGRPGDAVGPLRDAVRIDPGLPEAQVNLGNALLETGRPEEAIGCYRAAVALRPDYAVAHYNFGMALRSVGRLDEAAAQFAAAARLKGTP